MGTKHSTHGRPPFVMPKTKKQALKAWVEQDGRVAIAVNEKSAWCLYDETIILRFDVEELFTLKVRKVGMELCT